MPDGSPLRSLSVSFDEFARLMAGCAGRDTQMGALAVAVSGGADSMALCLLTHDWATANGVRLTALTVDHGLRLDSAHEAAQVGAWLGGWGINHHILTWKHDAKVTSRVQERARDARYALMRNWCLDHGVDRLLLAHHLEDQAETVLMRLKKGSGLLGLAGMAQVRDLGGVELARPLLDVAKMRLRATLSDFDQGWVEDPSNENTQFERVRTRQLLAHLERDGVSAGRFARAATSIARVRDVLDTAADELISKAEQVEAGLCIDAKTFLTAPETIKKIALSKLLMQVGSCAYPPAQLKLERVLAWMAVGRGLEDRARTLGGCVVRRTGQGDALAFHVLPESPRGSQKDRKNTGINCETGLAPPCPRGANVLHPGKLTRPSWACWCKEGYDLHARLTSD